MPYNPNNKDREKVKALASFGVRQDEIAGYIGIAPKTLRKYYREELDNSIITANAAVARVLYEKATVDRDTASVLFWLKTRAGWREVNRHEISGRDGKPVEIETKYKDIDAIMKERFKLLLNKDIQDVGGNIPK